MDKRKGPLGMLIAVPLLLTGCAAADAATSNAAPITSMTSSPSKSPNTTMSPGMSMSRGESTPGITSTTATPAADAIQNASGPSKATRMICGSETRGNVAKLMALQTPPPAKATWADLLYTCTYQLPVGPLVLSVKESADVAAARSYFNGMRAHLGHTKPLTGLAGLGFPAFEDTTGTVVFLKDNATLQVNATALPPQLGPENISRTDLAYAVATAVLACWSE